jgi:hypothetical protein
MKRREFLISGATLVGATWSIRALAAGKPCPPPGLSVSGGSSVNTSCVARTGGLPVLRLSSSQTGVLPWTFGQVFRKGDVAPGSIRAGAGVSAFQADVRNVWDDGSVKFAVLSGVSDFKGSPVQVPIATSGTSSGGAAVAEPTVAATVRFSSPAAEVSLADARATGPSAWGKGKAHKVRQIVGPVMSEFHYYSPVPGDEHLAVWWYVRAYSTGAVEVETVVENGWLLVPSPGQRSYTVAVNVGGTQRYSGGVTQYHHTRWSRVDWAGTDPAVVPAHDPQYLQQTNLVPTYAVSSLSAACYSTKPEYGTKFNDYSIDLADRPPPFHPANFDPAMGSGGDTDMYGILPIWGSAYCVEAARGAYLSVIANARAQGRYSLHYRDEFDGGPQRGSRNARLGLSDVNEGVGGSSGNNPTLTPAPSGTTNKWTYTHSPSSAFLAYWLTGRWTFWEELQFQTSTSELTQSGNWGAYRTIGWWEQNRFQGWVFRDRIQACHAAPQLLMGAPVVGSDSLQQAEAVGRVAVVAENWHDLYVSGSSTSAAACARGNVFGLPYQNADFQLTDASSADGEHVYGGLQTGIWITCALYGFDSEPPVSPPALAKLAGVAGHVAKWPVGMLGAAPGSTKWDWRVCTFVALGFGSPGGLSNSDDAGGRTVYRASWDAQWDAMKTKHPWVANAWTDLAAAQDNHIRKIQYDNVSALKLDVRRSFTGDTDIAAFCWAANYAHKVSARFNVPGIETAIARLRSSSMWEGAITGIFVTRPDFSVASGI